MHEELVALARSLVGRSRYVLRADTQDAPHILNCSIMTQWVFAQLGITIPRYAIEQYENTIPVHPDDLQAGDLVFMVGRGKRRLGHEDDIVGHVGILSGPDRFIHAANSKIHVVEAPLSNIPAEHLVAFGRVPELATQNPPL